VLVSEDAVANTVVDVIQAYDPDGDDVTFAFTGMSFEIIFIRRKLLTCKFLLH